MDEKNKEHQHDFDGIEELDNDLPRWWLGIFWITVAISVVYVPYYHFMRPDKLPEAAYQADVEAVEAVRAEEKQSIVENAEQGPSLAERYAAGGWQEGAKTTYDLFCVPCHLVDGGGSIGPNFTDDYYIHGGSLDDLVRVIAEGVPEKGMVAWKAQLKPDQIDALAFYIRDMRGTTPEVGKAAEGELFVDEVPETDEATQEQPQSSEESTETQEEGQ